MVRMCRCGKNCMRRPHRRREQVGLGRPRRRHAVNCTEAVVHERQPPTHKLARDEGSSTLPAQQFEHVVKGKVVLVRSDNFTVVTYINKEGGTKSPTLCYLTWDIAHWCKARHISLKAAHIAGVKNTQADLLSRKRVQHSEWRLHSGVL